MRVASINIRLYSLLALFITIFFLVKIASASPILIDFESYPWGASTSHLDPINTQFSSWGISLITSEDDSGNMVSAAIGQYTAPWLNYPSGVSALAPWHGDGTYYGEAQAPIHIHFASPINYFSIYAMDVGFNGLIIDAYGLGSTTPVSSVVIDGAGRYHNGPPGGDGLDFIEFNVSGIYEIGFSQIHDPDWDKENGLGLEGYLLDDMSFTMAPEPSTFLLLAFGFIGLAGFRRRHFNELNKEKF